MKFLVVFAALVAVAVGGPTPWTLSELSDALRNPNTHPAKVPYLEEALDEMMLALMSEQHMPYIMIELPIVKRFTKEELAQAILDPNTDPAFLRFYEEAYQELVDAFFAGIDKEYIDVVIPPGLLNPVKPEEVPMPEEVPIPEEVAIPEEIPAPAASSPLVQIIVNVQQQNQVISNVPVDADVDARI